ALAGHAQGGDSEPDRDGRGGHEYRPTNNAAGPLELVAERRLDGALAGAELAQSKTEVRVERSTGEPAFQLATPGCGCHPATAGRVQGRPPTGFHRTMRTVESARSVPIAMLNSRCRRRL